MRACPFARLIEDNRYCCAVSQTASDVKRGHWEATASCFEALAKPEAERAEPVAKVEAAPIAQTEATPATPAMLIQTDKRVEVRSPATTAPTAAATLAAIGTEDDAPPNRGDNGRGRVQPIAPKKLNLSLVAVKRITSDIPASNFDQFELEIAGSRVSGDRRLCYSQACASARQ